MGTANSQKKNKRNGALRNNSEKKAAEEKEKRDEENEKRVDEQAAKGREAEFKSFRKHVEYKKEQIAKEQEAKKKAEQDEKDRQPGHCTILNSAGGGTFSLLEAKSTINVELKAKNNNMLLKKNMKVLRRTTKFVGQLFNAARTSNELWKTSYRWIVS